MRKSLLLVLLLALFVMAAFAADLAGSWKGTLETPMGNQEMALTLKMDGANVTGSMLFFGNDTKLENVKLNGEKISFDVKADFGTMAYAGTVQGDTMNLTLSVVGMEVPVVLKRAQ